MTDRKPQHTPGPWRVVDQGERVMVECLDPNADWIAEAMGGYRRANADLIASAPALLAERDALREALQGLVAIIDKAGLFQLSCGVELGPAVWYVHASERMDHARAILAASTPEEKT